jgi:RNA polymerase sigma-70 factor (ECF subfamily)
MAYLTGDASLAEDLTQETFVSAWAGIGSYKGQASLGTWLHGIAYHKFIDSRRRLERHDTLITGLKQAGRDGPETSNPLHQLTADENSRFLYEAICRLESSDYLMIVLHYIQGLSFREMAKVLDKPVGTVKSRTSQALKRLKAFLTGRV